MNQLFDKLAECAIITVEETEKEMEIEGDAHVF